MPDKANFGAVLQPARARPADVCSTLNASFGEKQGLEDQHALGGAPCFVPAATCFAGSSFARYDESQSASTIRRDGGDLGGGSETFVAVPFRKSHRASSATDGESWVRAETANTLNSFDTGERDTHAVTAIATIDMQACKGNANIGDGSVSPTLCKPSGSDVHAIAFEPRYYTRDNKTGGAPQDVPSLRADASKVGDTSPCVAFTCKDYGADAGDVAPTLRAMPHDGSHANGGGQVAIAHGFYSTGGTHGVNMEPEVSPAVKVGSGLGIPSPPAVAVAMAVPFRKSHRASSATDGESWVRAETAIGNESDPMYTVRADGTQHAVGFSHSASSTSHGVAFMVEGSPPIRGGGAGNSMPAVATIAPSLTASNDPSRSPQSAEVTQQIAAVHQATTVVRRLTPVECSRLQGFPDDYTDIPWRGKAESPDGPRYKALGNSMAVNCMRWIGRRIDAVEKGTELPQ